MWHFNQLVSYLLQFHQVRSDGSSGSDEPSPLRRPDLQECDPGDLHANHPVQKVQPRDRALPRDPVHLMPPQSRRRPGPSHPRHRRRTTFDGSICSGEPRLLLSQRRIGSPFLKLTLPYFKPLPQAKLTTAQTCFFQTLARGQSVPP